MSEAEYMTAKQVRMHYGGVSDMWIFRKQRDKGFPMPATRFGGRRRYWRIADILAWEATMTGATTAPRPGTIR